MATRASDIHSTEAPGRQEAEDEGVAMPRARVVVGMDDSDAARDALAWAAAYARAHGARLEIIHAWQPSHEYAWIQQLPPPAPRTAVAEKELTKLVEEVVGFGVDTAIDVIEGHASRVLVDAADGADLLVLGRRGSGGFSGLLLGSVVQHCAAHAPCSVAIIRPSEPER